MRRFVLTAVAAASPAFSGGGAARAQTAANPMASLRLAGPYTTDWDAVPGVLNNAKRARWEDDCSR